MLLISEGHVGARIAFSINLSKLINTIDSHTYATLLLYVKTKKTKISQSAISVSCQSYDNVKTIVEDYTGITRSLNA